MSLIEITQEQFLRGEYVAPPCPTCGKTTLPGIPMDATTFDDPVRKVAITTWKCPDGH